MKKIILFLFLYCITSLAFSNDNYCKERNCSDIKSLTEALLKDKNVNIKPFLAYPFDYSLSWNVSYDENDNFVKFLEVAMPIAKENPDLAFYIGATLRAHSWKNLIYQTKSEKMRLYRKQIEYFKIALNSEDREIKELTPRILGNIYYFGLLRSKVHIVDQDYPMPKYEVNVDYKKASEYYSMCLPVCEENYIASVVRFDSTKGLDLLESLPSFNNEITSDWESSRKKRRQNSSAEFKFSWLWSIYKYGLFGFSKDQIKSDKYLETLKKEKGARENSLLNLYPPKNAHDVYELSEFFQKIDDLFDRSHSPYLPQNNSVELQLLRQAVSEKHHVAAYMLHSKYKKGNGVMKDFLKAYAYLNIALEYSNISLGERGDSRYSKYFNENAYRKELNKLEEEMTVSHIIYAQQLSNEIITELKNEFIKDTKKSKNTSGTGFYISKNGYMVTNQHVVDSCKAISINRDGKSIPVNLVVEDIRNDIALIKSDDVQNFAYIRDGRGIRQGNQIIAYGYPLSGILSSSAKVTTGMVNALSGLGDDFRYMQISAPVQPGNSGGPLLDEGGNIVGIVTAKINAAEILETTGDIPQNINFALKLSVLKDLLDANEINYETRVSSESRNIADIVDEAKKYTVKVECSK